ncbi:SMI1/KNR4 family protein [Trichocoleus sp. FACHB-262]|uniref:SMI1/KNR4 family protein n=1 Tax=Trichocoleus sp. FACHB-262 TaxID=2692869 RepID=UPI0016878F6E|nr:SMI1/KNR4 family protein [Trichocoleus sp. FACHB-262]MBD2121075.1 SMI1/KNR4 family protein [Trichocoleus sp. FACHB-262]
MEIIWKKIDSWLTTHAPQVMESLHSEATDEEIAQAEAFFGVDFPDDLRLSYRIHNGQAEDSYSLFPELEFLSLQSMIAISQKWQDCANEDFRCAPEDISEGIWNGWWNRYWIPFTNESNGACECVDLAPAAGGCVGQVVIVEWQEPARQLVAPSFRAYLERFADTLERGEYQFSEDGYGLVDLVDFEILESNK